MVTVHTAVLKPMSDNSHESLAGARLSAKSQKDEENQDTVLKEHGARCACVRSRTVSGTSEGSEDGVPDGGHTEVNLDMDMKRLSVHMMAALTLEETRLGSTLVRCHSHYRFAIMNKNYSLKIIYVPMK